MLNDALSLDPALEVVGTASNGRIALAKLSQVGADVVILDVEMPEVDGLETLAAIRKTYPRLPVILFSALTERGAAVTLEALAMGASDYVTKPTSTNGSALAEDRIRGELIPRVKALCDTTRRVAAPASSMGASAPVSPARKARPALPSRVDIVAIGASTGGPAVLCELLPRIPAGFPAPILIVQHMPPVFTKLLSERLASISRLHVLEGTSPDTLRSGTAWIAPGDSHMVVERSGMFTRIGKNKETPRNSCRPSVDALFESVAEVFGPSALAVVLTGMGQDGLEGCTRIRQAGGQVLVQDEESSVVWGMPGVVARAGLADAVLPREQLAQEIIRRVGAKRSFLNTAGATLGEAHE